MFLNKIEKSVLTQPIILLQGISGSGKTTFCSQIPNNLYLGVENTGTDIENLIGKKHFQKYDDLKNILLEIRDIDKFDFKSVTIDSLTTVNYLMEQKILDDHLNNGKRSDNISDNSNKLLNFGQGDKILTKMWEDLLDLIIQIRDIKNVRFNLIAHQVQAQISNSLEETTITKEIADINKKALNKVLASVDIVMAIEKVYKLKDYKEGFMGGPNKKMVKQETTVLRMNSDYIMGKVRDQYFDPNVVKNGIITIDGEEYDLGEYPLSEKNKMFDDFEKLIHPTLKLKLKSAPTVETKKTGIAESIINKKD